MLSTTNIAKSNCFTNFRHSDKSILRWCGLRLRLLVLRIVLEFQRGDLFHHPWQSSPLATKIKWKKTVHKKTRTTCHCIQWAIWCISFVLSFISCFPSKRRISCNMLHLYLNNSCVWRHAFVLCPFPLAIKSSANWKNKKKTSQCDRTKPYTQLPPLPTCSISTRGRRYSTSKDYFYTMSFHFLFFFVKSSLSSSCRRSSCTGWASNWLGLTRMSSFQNGYHPWKHAINLWNKHNTISKKILWRQAVVRCPFPLAI